MTNPNDTYLLLYCRIGSKKLLNYDRQFFERIDGLVDDIDHTSSDTGIIACIKSKVDIETMHKELLKHGKRRKRKSSVVLIDLRSGNAKGNLNSINPKEIDHEELLKFDPLVGSKKNLLNTKNVESQIPSEEEVNLILDHINSKGINMLTPKDKEKLDRYSAYLNNPKLRYADERKR